MLGNHSSSSPTLSLCSICISGCKVLWDTFLQKWSLTEKHVTERTQKDPILNCTTCFVQITDRRRISLRNSSTSFAQISLIWLSEPHDIEIQWWNVFLMTWIMVCSFFRHSVYCWWFTVDFFLVYWFVSWCILLLWTPRRTVGTFDSDQWGSK